MQILPLFLRDEVQRKLFILYPARSAESKRLCDLCMEQSLASLHLINIIRALRRVHENLPMEAATVGITVQTFNVGILRSFSRKRNEIVPLHPREVPSRYTLQQFGSKSVKV